MYRAKCAAVLVCCVQTVFRSSLGKYQRNFCFHVKYMCVSECVCECVNVTVSVCVSVSGVWVVCECEWVCECVNVTVSECV